jgi:hypothetical protein
LDKKKLSKTGAQLIIKQIETDYKAQTLIWGYFVSKRIRFEEFRSFFKGRDLQLLKNRKHHQRDAQRKAARQPKRQKNKRALTSNQITVAL